MVVFHVEQRTWDMNTPNPIDLPAAVPNATPASAAHTGPQRKELLALARRSIEAAAASGEPAPVPEFEPWLAEPKGCFVTLTKAGRLRGCIGHIFPKESLAAAVVDNARSAAIRDTRFPAVTPEEVPGLRIEISILTPPEPLVFGSPEELLAKLVPGRDGVVLKIHGHSATYLPQVWETCRTSAGSWRASPKKPDARPGRGGNPGPRC